MNRRVVIGSTIGNDYSAFLPFSCLLWRDRIGYVPSVFLVGTADEWRGRPWTAVVVRALMGHGLHTEYIDHIPGVEDGTIAQCIRQHAAAYEYDPVDLLIPSDADLLPIGRALYWKHNPDTHAIGLIYHNGYGDPTHFPSCHMSMRVQTWREVMGLEGVGFRDAMIRNFGEYGLEAKMAAKKADSGKNWGHVWFTDEFVASKKIIESKYYPHQIDLIDRQGQPPRDRLDRSCWPVTYNVLDYTDVHSIRPIWNAANWPRFRPIIEQTMPERMPWAEQYIAEFREAMEG